MPMGDLVESFAEKGIKFIARLENNLAKTSSA